MLALCALPALAQRSLLCYEVLLLCYEVLLAWVQQHCNVKRCTYKSQDLCFCALAEHLALSACLAGGKQVCMLFTFCI